MLRELERVEPRRFENGSERVLAAALLARQQTAEACGVVGEDAVNLEVDEALPLGGVVGGSDVDGDPGGFEGLDDISVDDGDVDHLDGLGAEGVGRGGVVSELLAGVQEDERNLRVEFAHGMERAVVEALQHHLAGDTVVADLLIHGSGEPLGVDRGVDLGLDHQTGVAFPGEGEDFGERGDAFAGDELLLREVGAAGGAAVEGADFGKGHRVDRLAGEIEVMMDDELIVLGDDDVEFEDVGSYLEGVFKGGDRVFRAESPAAAMAQH